MIKVYDKGDLKTVGIYFKLTNKTLEGVENRTVDLTDPDTINKISKENGNNIHFFLCISKGVRYILRGIRILKVKENPKSISWFSPNMEQFFIRRILCHQ